MLKTTKKIIHDERLSDFADLSPETQAKIDALANGIAAGIVQRAAQQGVTVTRGLGDKSATVRTLALGIMRQVLTGGIAVRDEQPLDNALDKP